MHVSKLFVFGTMFLAADAFRCAVGQQGSCTFVESNSKQHRCAIKCDYKGIYAQCNCPKYYPRNNKKWPYGGKHACISTPQYVDRFFYGAGNFKATWNDRAIDVMKDQEEPQGLLGKLKEGRC
ncbi:hypothetical protein HYE68_001329 [Fusarium pseudograminearum]|nr:hypothetical protein HYE68_001329 [Fusarium pseudograminearum]